VGAAYDFVAWDYASKRCPGRPSTAAAIRKLIVRIVGVQAQR
jgi:hypothetical protein